MTSPPRLAEAVLRLCLPKGLSRESLLGDLEADFHHVRKKRGAGLAWAWYWVHALRLSCRYTWERAFGGRRLVRRGQHESRRPITSQSRSSFLERLLQDVRYAARTLAREPSWTAATLGTLALGIGATTAIFTVVNGILIRPLDYPASGELVVLEYRPEDPATAAEWATYDAYMSRHMSRNVSYPAFESWQQATSDLFADLGVYDDAWTHDVGFGVGAGTERLAGTIASSGLLRALGISPVRGRLFTAEDDAVGAPGTVIISHGLWMRRFGGDLDVVGKTVDIRGETHTIVGIMPREFAFPSASAEFWISMATASRGRGSTNYQVVGRVRDDLPVADVRTALQARSILVPGRDEVVHRFGAGFTTLREYLVGEVRPMLLLFMAAVGALLLIACVNVVNLMLTRATRREHERLVRAAVGAGPGRLTQQLLTESLMVSMLGAGLGLVLAFLLVNGLLSLAPGTLPRRDAIGIDATVLLFSLAVAGVVGIAVGLIPALQASRTRLVVQLNHAMRGSSANSGQGRLRDGLVVLQLAMAMVLLVGGGLLSRSFVSLLGEETGFDAQNVLTFETSLPSSRYETFLDRRQFYDDLLLQVGALPGVQDAALAIYVPASGSFHWTDLVVEGYTPTAGEEPETEIMQVSPGYFSTLGIRMLEGRDFDVRDDESAPPVVAVSQSLARAYFPSGRALGGRVLRDEEWATVVAVIDDVRFRGAERNAPVVYEPFAASERRGGMDVLLRVDRDPGSLAPSVARLVAALDPEVTVYGVLPLEARLWEAVSGPRFRTVLLGAFGLVSLLLSVIGVYGVMAYMVGQRTREIGIRRVLGARPESILRQVAARGMLLTSTGIALGVFGANRAAVLLGSYLYDLEPNDPLTLALAAAALALASMAACLVPAMRAARVDPLIALRFE